MAKTTDVIDSLRIQLAKADDTYRQARIAHETTVKALTAAIAALEQKC